MATTLPGFTLLPEDEKRRIWSRLPDLNSHELFRTAHPSKSEFVLDQKQLLHWWDFEDEVRQVVGHPKPNYDELVNRIYHGVGNETGVQACFIGQVSDVISRTLDNLGLRVVMGDFQSGISSVKAQQGKHHGKLCPDLVMWAGQKRYIRIVGEMKTPWTFKKLKRQT